MKMNRSGALVAVLMLALGFAAVASAEPLQTRTSNVAAVTVKVKPLDLTPEAKSWDFEVTMNTHTQPLDQDLASVSVLVDDTGKQHMPSGWKGDPPGGHHRKGVLQFAPVPGSPKALELRITGLGATDARVFAWKLR